VAVRVDETLESAAIRALTEKAGGSVLTHGKIFLDQLAAFDAIYRDPRGRTVSVVYMGLTRTISREEKNTIWRPADAIKNALPFDHDLILETAVNRLKGKLRYTNIAAALLPETFLIDDLQAVYEAALGRQLNRANFRSKLLKIGMIEQATVMADAVGKKGGRPPYLYRFTHHLVESVDRDFL
jgi:8-oxo-dGTP diphosphatase